MTFARAAAALLIAVSTALFLPSCAGVLGVADEPTDIVQKMCQCGLGSFDSTASCTATVNARFLAASDATVTAWLAKYDAECQSCATIDVCFDQLPACSPSTCKVDLDCCNHRMGVKCVNGNCQ